MAVRGTWLRNLSILNGGVLVELYHLTGGVLVELHNVLSNKEVT